MSKKDTTVVVEEKDGKKIFHVDIGDMNPDEAVQSLLSVMEDNQSPENFAITVDNDGNSTVTDLTPNAGDVDAVAKYSALQAVQHALSLEPLEFENMVKIGLADRLQNTVEKRREEVAQSIFGVENSEVDASDNNAEEDDKEDKEVGDENAE